MVTPQAQGSWGRATQSFWQHQEWLALCPGEQVLSQVQESVSIADNNLFLSHLLTRSFGVVQLKAWRWFNWGRSVQAVWRTQDFKKN